MNLLSYEADWVTRFESSCSLAIATDCGARFKYCVKTFGSQSQDRCITPTVRLQTIPAETLEEVTVVNHTATFSFTSFFPIDIKTEAGTSVSIKPV